MADTRALVRRASAVFVVASCLAGAASIGVGIAQQAHAATTPPSVRQLSGTFRLSPGRCAGNRPTGSYLSVTFGTKIIGNKSSACDHGAYTLLRPGKVGLATGAVTPSSQLAFNSAGNAISDQIAQPAKWDGRELSIVTSQLDLQDAPTGPKTFALPQFYAVGDQLDADVRDVQVLWNGYPGTCASDFGRGCWLVGTEHATGSIDPQTNRFNLEWFSGTSFVAASAATTIHLAGSFRGRPQAVPQGKTVELGTDSFAAGPPPPATAAWSRTGRTKSPQGRSTRTRSNSHAAAGKSRARLDATLAADASKPRASSPKAFVVGELLVIVDILALVTYELRRRNRSRS